jgi:hypothetical protein
MKRLYTTGLPSVEKFENFMRENLAPAVAVAIHWYEGNEKILIGVFEMTEAEFEHLRVFKRFENGYYSYYRLHAPAK